MNKKEQEQFYNEIVAFYDLAEDLIDIIEREGAKNPAMQARLALPVIEQTQESAEVLAEAYITFVENGEQASPSEIRKVEGAIRKIFGAVLAFIEAVKELPIIVGKKTIATIEEYRKKYENSIAYKLLKDPSLLWSGPYSKKIHGFIESRQDVGELVKGVWSIGNHAEVIVRALQTMGLVVNIEKVEPGYAKQMATAHAHTRSDGFLSH